MDTSIGGGSASNLFKKPGSTTNSLINLLIPAAIIGAVIWFFGGTIGDYIVNAMDNMLHMVLVGGVLVFIGALFLDPKKRAWYMYRSFTRFLTGLFIDIDPIGILKSYKERMEGKLAEMQESISALKGQRVKTVKHQQENLAALDNEYRLMQQAQKVNDASAMNVHSKQVTRLDQRKTRYEGELNRLNLLVAIMDKYYNLCNTTILDMGNEIKYREEERDEAKQSRKAVGAAMSILKGLPEKELWDEATLKLENDYSQAIGEVENFLDVTKNILSTSDLQDGADAGKAMEMLDSWQKKNSNVALGGQGSQMTKTDIIRDAVSQIQGNAPAATTAPLSAKPVYLAATTGGDDYLSLGSKFVATELPSHNTGESALHGEYNPDIWTRNL